MLIGITGTDGAGKGAAVDYLVKEKNFTHYSARAIWEEEFKKRSIESSRENMRLVANEMRATYGNDFLVTFYLERMKKEQVGKAIIESIRATAEAETLRQNGGSLLAIDAEQMIRYQRISGRKSASDSVTLAEFSAQEELEMNDPDPNGMQKAKVMAMADFTIQNNGTLAELREQIEVFLENINHPETK